MEMCIPGKRVGDAVDVVCDGVLVPFRAVEQGARDAVRE